MNLRQKIRKSIENISGYRISRQLPIGIDFAFDVAKANPNFDPKLIFDVGANIGQSAIAFAEDFPDAEIYSFEPGASAFAKLSVASQDHKINAFKLALGSRPGTGFLSNNSGNDKLNQVTQQSQTQSGCEAEATSIETLDGFCKKNDITRIDFLKIDTEGNDLEVLKGAAGMLSSASIEFVQTEVGVSKQNNRHVPMQEIIEYLDDYNYSVFGFYNQAREWVDSSGVLRRCDLVFLRGDG